MGVVVLIRGGRVGGVLRLDVGGILELRLGGKSIGFDDARIALLALHAECIAHRTGDDLELVVVHGGKCDEHDEEAHHQAHKVGEGHDPAVPPSMRVATFFLGHWARSGCGSTAYAGTGSPSSWRC